MNGIPDAGEDSYMYSYYLALGSKVVGSESEFVPITKPQTPIIACATVISCDGVAAGLM